MTEEITSHLNAARECFDQSDQLGAYRNLLPVFRNYHKTKEELPKQAEDIYFGLLAMDAFSEDKSIHDTSIQSGFTKA